MKCILIKDFLITKDSLFKIEQLFYNQGEYFWSCHGNENQFPGRSGPCPGPLENKTEIKSDPKKDSPSIIRYYKHNGEKLSHNL